jgi:hypothetical protein
MKNDGMTLVVQDVSGQKRALAKDVDPELPARVLVERLIQDLRVPRNDVEGRVIAYSMVRARDRVHINPSERIGASTQPGDVLVLQPEVEAG